MHTYNNKQSLNRQDKPKRLKRLVLTSFVFTFICARMLVLLIMSRNLPDLYLHLGGTHVHHLNYGIFLLSIVGAALLFTKPAGKWLDLAAIAYGAGLALTFDEFGMWLHLGGSYWQRASFDAITVIGGILLLLAFMPPLKYWTKSKVFTAIILALLLGLFVWRWSLSLINIEQNTMPKLERLELQGPV